MAIVLEHGPNGSYKTSSVIWYRLLTALREGRVVVTNILGLFPLEEIEKRLGEKFPDSARLFRVFALDADMRALWRRWFHWMPIGALVIIDECQDIFPKTGWKSQELDLKPIDIYRNHLPADLIEYFKSTHDKYKPVLDSCDTDDSGRLLLNVDGTIIYPANIDEAWTRHRHFNWDVIFVTPAINHLSDLIRSCSEVAFSYASKDSLFWRKRKPRIYEHRPKENGVPSKTDPVFSRHVPVAVHLLYKSTQTGAVVKSGQSVGPLSTVKGKVVFYFVIPATFFGFFYLCYYFISILSGSGQSSVTPAPAAVSVSVKASPGAHTRNDGNAVVAPEPVKPSFLMPFNSTEVWISGVSGYIDKHLKFRGVVIFNLDVDKKQLSVDDSILSGIGYHYRLINDCVAELRDPRGLSRMITCKPDEISSNPITPDAAHVIASNSPLISPFSDK